MVEPTKVCPMCKDRKPWSQYHVKARWPDGSTRQPHTYCKPCHNEYRREWQYKRWHEDREWAQRRMQRKTKARMDPESYAASLAYRRDWTRRKRGISPDRHRTGGTAERIPSDAIRAAVERSGLTFAEIAKRADLGKDGARDALKRETVALDKAHAILEAIGVLPVELGL